jgi:ATP-dependent Clp protease protease subunit
MIHQPLIGGGLGGQQTDIMIHAKNLERTRDRLESILAANTGKTLEQIHIDCERDNYMMAQEAMEYGLIDKVIEKR